MKTFHRLHLIIFQTDNPASASRFEGFLGRKGWTRFTRGIYQHLQPVEDKQAFWEKVRTEYLISDQDFFAFISADEVAIMSELFYNKKSPNWPTDRPFSDQDEDL